MVQNVDHRRIQNYVWILVWRMFVQKSMRWEIQTVMGKTSKMLHTFIFSTLISFEWTYYVSHQLGFRARQHTPVYLYLAPEEIRYNTRWCLCFINWYYTMDRLSRPCIVVFITNYRRVSQLACQSTMCVLLNRAKKQDLCSASLYIGLSQFIL